MYSIRHLYLQPPYPFSSVCLLKLFSTYFDADYIISNPPYSIRTKVLQELFKRDIPFAMLLGVVGMFESQERFEMFRDNDFEVLYMNKRISFFQDFTDQKPAINPPFSTAYFCHNILPKQIVFEKINKNDLSIKKNYAKRLV